MTSKAQGSPPHRLMRSGNRLAMVHIGDSRYVLRGDTLTRSRQTTPFVQYLPTPPDQPEEAEHHPNRRPEILGDAQADVP